MTSAGKSDNPIEASGAKIAAETQKTVPTQEKKGGRSTRKEYSPKKILSAKTQQSKATVHRQTPGNKENQKLSEKYNKEESPKQTPEKATQEMIPPSSEQTSQKNKSKITVSPVPPETVEKEKSLSIPDKFDIKVIGTDTEELSDESFESSMEKRKRRSTSSSMFGQIYSIVRRDKRIRAWTLFNAILLIFNFALLCLVIITGVQILYLQFIRDVPFSENPCLYEYKEWSSCSASCYDGVNYPVKHRTVIANSIIRARGERHEPCPENLLNKVDIAPCNTYKCPSPLSSYPYRNECFYYDASKGKAGGCYRIRKIPLEDILITIDAEIIERCDDNDCVDVDYW